VKDTPSLSIPGSSKCRGGGMASAPIDACLVHRGQTGPRP
jgi:hypothetical protein